MIKIYNMNDGVISEAWIGESAPVPVGWHMDVNTAMKESNAQELTTPDTVTEAPPETRTPEKGCAMTLLTISNAIADTTSGPRPATIIGNTNTEAQSYLRAITKVGLRLMKHFPWNILRKENAFTGTGAETLVASASMPSDFDRFIPETFWNRSTAVLLSGPIQASRWQSMKAEGYSGDNPVFTYRGGDILALPTVGASASMVFEYISNQYIESTLGVAQSTWLSDTDVSVLDEELLALGATFDWLVSEGLPAEGAFREFKDYFDVLQDNENSTENIAVTADIFAQSGRHWDGTPAASRTVSASS